MTNDLVPVRVVTLNKFQAGVVGGVFALGACTALAIGLKGLELISFWGYGRYVAWQTRRAVTSAASAKKPRKTKTKRNSAQQHSLG